MKQKIDEYKSPLIRLKGKTVKATVMVADSVNYYTGTLVETDGEAVLLRTSAGLIYLKGGFIISIEVLK
jgi:tRNA uridine 5-carbamoylmethylation protein Kti12